MCLILRIKAFAGQVSEDGRCRFVMDCLVSFAILLIGNAESRCGATNE
jgi:hypothetical protein